MTLRIKQIIRHPEFQISNFKNDIAILKLDSQVPLDSPHIQPACLPSTGTNVTSIVLFKVVTHSHLIQQLSASFYSCTQRIEIIPD